MTKEIILKEKNIFDEKINNLQNEKEKYLSLKYIQLIKENKNSLIGVEFSTGQIDDMYQVKSIEGDSLILFQTWDYENGDLDEILIDELSFNQMEEIIEQL